MFDIRLKENFKLFLVGPSACGKSVFIQNLLQNISTVAKKNPSKIIYVYKVWQPLFQDMNLHGLVHIFIEDNENLVEKLKMETIGETCLIVFDDLINSKNLDEISNLFVVDGRHSNYSMIFTSQRMFVNTRWGDGDW